MNENPGRKGRLSRIGGRRLLVVPWGAVIGVLVYEAAVDSSIRNTVLIAAFGTLFVLLQVQARLSQRALYRGLRQLELRLDNASYLSEFQSIPNRNYLLDQLRREMPRARAFGEPFVLVIVSIDDLAGIVARRGEAYGNLAMRSLARVIERFTRASDFAAQLEEGCYSVLLYDCTGEMALSYLRRIPGTLAVSTGKRMLEIPLTVRVSEYDMESLYAIDVLRDVEEAPPARPPEELRLGAEAA